METDSKWRLLFHYLKKYKRWGLWGSLFMMLSVLMLIPTPLLTIYLIDTVLPKGDLRMLSFICTLTLFILIANGACNLLQTLFFSKFNSKVVFDIRMDIIKNLQKSPTLYRQKQQTGYLLSRVNEDPNRLQNLFANTFSSLIKDVIILIVGITLLFILNWQLALLVLVLLPFFILSLRYFGFKIRLISSKLYESGAQFLKKLQESISLMDTFILFNAEKSDQIKLIGKQKYIVRTEIKKNMIQSFASVSIAIIGGIAPIAILWFGISEIINGNLTLGKLIAFNTFVGYVFGPTSRMINTALSMHESLAAWERVYEMLRKIPSVKNPDIYGQKHKIMGEIKIQDISFKYENSTILKNINLSISKNQTVAIVGESGSGKSTLVSLITTMNHIQHGCISVDEINIYDIANYVQQTALVQQEPTLIADTIFENIRLGNSSATDSDIFNAAKQAQIHDFIESLPLKYNTIVDERGCNMSVGQKQRIAIARCIVRDPAIFIMDEATANLDSGTEKALLADLHDFIKSRTTFIIAHRLSTIVFADKIVVLNKGEIVEEGNFETLLRQGGIFYNLWEHQIQ